jgi:23S rRNA (adenine2030-N6)-methyltransferase
MLSYRHAFHAGNHADVLKHFVEVSVLDYLLGKDKPLCYIDTHAGPGMYDLTAGYAAQNEEFNSGIARLWQEPSLPAPLQRYVDCVRALNPDGSLGVYPGSPALARQLLRGSDRLSLFELHPSDFGLLQQWAHGDRRIQLQQRNGFEGLIAALPPRERRGLVLIDPPYEVKQDYQLIVSTLNNALKRFATGVYMIWYPLLARDDVARMTRAVRALSQLRWLNAELNVSAVTEKGMYGSGVFVVNPPWPLQAQLQECLPVLASVLGTDAGKGFTLQHNGI